MTKKTEDKKEVKLRDDPYRVFIVGGNYDYVRFLYTLGYRGATCLEEADFVLFTGGEDVNPQLYGEKPLSKTFFNMKRDEDESEIFDWCVEHKKPMVGICRGGQFLNVKNKGAMWQHIDGHMGDHPMLVVDAKGKVISSFMVTSTHHQMMVPAEHGEVFAIAGKATKLLGYGKEGTPNPKKASDVEVVWYGDTGCLCFQPHPEFKSAPVECKNYFAQLLDNVIIPYVWTAENK